MLRPGDTAIVPIVMVHRKGKPSLWRFLLAPIVLEEPYHLLHSASWSSERRMVVLSPPEPLRQDILKGA